MAFNPGARACLGLTSDECCRELLQAHDASATHYSISPDKPKSVDTCAHRAQVSAQKIRPRERHERRSRGRKLASPA